MKRFVAPWLKEPKSRSLVPLAFIGLRTRKGLFQYRGFLVDSGAHISMASRRISDLLGIDWAAGRPMTMQGVVPGKECAIVGRVHDIEVHIREIGHRMTLPICFAEAEAPSLIGREVFFNKFLIEFNALKLETTFTLQNS